MPRMGTRGNKSKLTPPAYELFKIRGSVYPSSWEMAPSPFFSTWAEGTEFFFAAVCEKIILSPVLKIKSVPFFLDNRWSIPHSFGGK